MDTKPFDRNRCDPVEIQMLDRIDIVAKIIANGMMQGIHRSRKKGFSSEFADFKPYTHGDDLRHLDWGLFARSERLYVKQLEAETNIEVMLVLDASGSMAWRWQDTINKLEYAARLMAALSYFYITQQDQVGLLVHDATNLHYLPPRARRVQIEEIFAVLENLRSSGADTFPALVHDLAQRKKHRGHVIICSDLEENEEELEGAILSLAAREDEVILVHLLDQAEVELPFRDATHIKDSETGELLQVNMGELKRQHEERLAGFREHWRILCVKAGVIYIPADTGMNFLDVIQAMQSERHV